MASGQLDGARLRSTALIGELALDGSLRPVPGALALVAAALAGGATDAIVPAENGAEGAAVDASYRYDGAGHRIGATVDGVASNYLIDVRGLGSVLSDGARRFLPGDPTAGYEESGAWLNGLANSQGTVVGYAGASGMFGALTHFDPFGSPLPASVSLPTGPGFTGEWTDATGLVNLRFRPYDPSLQSFFGRDTFGGVASAPLSGNRYAYAMGNPLRYTDPSGHFVNEFMRDPGLFISIAVQMLPVVGDAYSFVTGAIGFDPIAGITLSGVERGLAMGVGLAPGGGFHLLGRLGGRAGGDIAQFTGRADGLANAGRVDGFTSAGRLDLSPSPPIAPGGWKRTKAPDGPGSQTVFHGSYDNASNIRNRGLDASRAPTYVTRQRAAAQNAIDHRIRVEPHRVTDPGIVQFTIPNGAYNDLARAGHIFERPYPGFPGPQHSADWTEIRLDSTAIEELNRYLDP